MRRVALIFLIVFSSLFAHSQIYIGLTEAEIQSRVKHTEILTRYVMADGAVSLALEYKENAAYVRRYYIDKKTGRCFLYVLQPKDKVALDTFIKFCNDNYEASNRENQWGTNICLSYTDGKCVDDIDVSVQLLTVRATGNRMFYFIPVRSLRVSSL